MSFKFLSKLLFRSCQNSFGEDTIYESKEKGLQQVRGILSQAYTLVKESGFNSEVSSSQLVFDLQLSDLDFKPCLQDKVMIGETWYKIINLEPNHQGQIKLVLKKVERGMRES